MTEPTTDGPRPLDEPTPVGEPRLDGLARLVAVVDRLRDPDGGCPWDLEQTTESLTASLLEEAFEAVEAIERRAEAAEPRALDEHVAEELGDLAMNLVLLARIEEDAGRPHLGAWATRVADKLVRRHPHVFGEVAVDGVGEVLTNWEAIKRAERAERGEDESALAGVPEALPALQRAWRLGGKAQAAGFRWRDSRGALVKVREETAELEAAFGAGDEPDPARRDELEAELGDLLMAAALFGRYADVDPERALRRSLRRFERRFRAVEAAFDGDLSGASLEAMMAAWQAAKAAE